MELLWLQQAINSRKEVGTPLEPCQEWGLGKASCSVLKQSCLVQCLFSSPTVSNSQTNTDIPRDQPAQRQAQRVLRTQGTDL